MAWLVSYQSSIASLCLDNFRLHAEKSIRNARIWRPYISSWTSPTHRKALVLARSTPTTSYERIWPIASRIRLSKRIAGRHCRLWGCHLLGEGWTLWHLLCRLVHEGIYVAPIIRLLERIIDWYGLLWLLLLLHRLTEWSCCYICREGWLCGKRTCCRRLLLCWLMSCGNKRWFYCADVVLGSSCVGERWQSLWFLRFWWCKWRCFDHLSACCCKRISSCRGHRSFTRILHERIWFVGLLISQERISSLHRCLGHSLRLLWLPINFLLVLSCRIQLNLLLERLVGCGCPGRLSFGRECALIL